MSQNNRFAALSSPGANSQGKGSGKKKSKRAQEADESQQLLTGAPPARAQGASSPSAAAAGANEDQQNAAKLIRTDQAAAADQMMQVNLGAQRYEQMATRGAGDKDGGIVEEAGHDDEYESDSDLEIDEDTREVIKIVNVHKTYLLGIEGVPALRGVNLTIQDGEFVTILGTSGGGKTTLLNIIGTIDKPSKGDVYICGLRIKFSTKDTLLASIRLNKLGFVFQTFNLIGSLTALENVELPMQLQGKLSREEIRNRARQLLKDVGLEQRMDHFPNQLSGGEQQRVTIARSIANKPKILLLDEPTGDLDTRSTDIVMKILIDLNMREKITMIMVTHDVGLKYFAHRVVKMADGKVNQIVPIPSEAREEMISDLNKRVDAIHSGRDQDQLMIREGINLTDDQQSKRIPENYRCLVDQNTATKTSVRKPRDYPVLQERFQK